MNEEPANFEQSIAADDANFAAAIKQICDGNDQESNHIAADQFLIDLLKKWGFHKTVSAFEDVEKWYA